MKTCPGLVFCRHVVEDKRTGNPSLIDITERIGFRGDLPEGNGPVKPAFSISLLHRIEVVEKLKLTLSLGNYIQARVIWLSPDGDELAQLIEHELGFGERGR